MASFKERMSARVERVRERYPLGDHLVRMVRHYSAVDGNAQAYDFYRAHGFEEVERVDGGRWPDDVWMRKELHMDRAR